MKIALLLMVVALASMAVWGFVGPRGYCAEQARIATDAPAIAQGDLRARLARCR